jgi:hypothetical protein
LRDQLLELKGQPMCNTPCFCSLSL